MSQARHRHETPRPFAGLTRLNTLFRLKEDTVTLGREVGTAVTVLLELVSDHHARSQVSRGEA